MIPVSAQWKNANLQNFRYPAYLRATIKVVPPGLTTSQIITTEDTFQHSTTDIFKEETVTEVTPYASLENNRWRLDESFVLLRPDTVTDDWWSREVVEDAPSVITFVFDQLYDIPGVYFRWDVVNNTYPSHVRIQLYDAGNALLKAVDLTHIDSSSGFYEVPVNGVKRVVVSIFSWSPARWRARITEVIFGVAETFSYIDRITSASSLDRSDSLNKKLPAHNFDFTLRNLDRKFDPMRLATISKYLAVRQLIQFEWGFSLTYNKVEWTPKLSYYITGFDIPADSKDVSITTGSRLDFLTKKFIFDNYQAVNRTLYDLALLILTKSNVLIDFEGQVPWQLSESLRGMGTMAPLPVANSNVLLQYIASMACLPLKTDPVTGFISISNLNTSVVHSITPSQELGDPTIKLTEAVKRVTANVYSYTVEAEESDIGTSEYLIAGNITVQVEYSSPALNVNGSVTGAAVRKVTYYSNYAEFQLTAPETVTAVKITLLGKKVVSTISVLDTYFDSSLAQGDTLVIDNPLITDVDSAVRVTQHMLSRYKIAQDFNGLYTGYPELTSGDHISLETVYGTVSIPVYSNTVEYNGGWSGTVQTAKGDTKYG